MKPCTFCEIAARRIPAEIVYETDAVLAFLDHRPLFPGHVLLIPKQHVITLAELPAAMLEPLFVSAQRLERAVESAMHAEGSFIAMNNRVSQSVPHLHVHIVPRTKGDGLKGFFWPRVPYKDEEHLAETARVIRAAIKA